MKIVIEIPKMLYEKIKNGKADKKTLETVIIMGTSLQKGHGRLKDVDWIDDNCEVHHSDTDGSWCYTWKDIDNAPTIIEADKEG